MSSVISDSRNAEMVRNEMLALKEILLLLARQEEINTFSKQLAQKTTLGFTSRARYTRTLSRADECELGQRYYDVCQILLNAFVKSFWIEPARIVALQIFSDIHGVTVTGERTDRRGDRIVAQDYKFLCDWREELGLDMLIRISLKITGSAPHEMIVDYIKSV